MQDTVDANYMLLTAVVNRHNCVAVRRRTMTTQCVCVNATIEINVLNYNVAIGHSSMYGEFVM